MKYKIHYRLPSDPSCHFRYYTALTPETALAMFSQTVEDGSLSGSKPEVIEMYKLVPPQWQLVPKKEYSHE